MIEKKNIATFKTEELQGTRASARLGVEHRQGVIRKYSTQGQTTSWQSTHSMRLRTSQSHCIIYIYICPSCPECSSQCLGSLTNLKITWPGVLEWDFSNVCEWWMRTLQGTSLVENLDSCNLWWTSVQAYYKEMSWELHWAFKSPYSAPLQPYPLVREGFSGLRLEIGKRRREISLKFPNARCSRTQKNAKERTWAKKSTTASMQVHKRAQEGVSA